MTAPALHIFRRGFSLVETLVAISILLLVVVGPLTVSSRAAKSSTYSTEQQTAHFLAQEGLELAEKARDDFILDNFDNPLNGGWVAFINTSGEFANCFLANGCGLTLTTNATEAFVEDPRACDPAAANNPCLLYKTTAANVRSRFTHVTTGAEVTPFTRTIRFTQVANGGTAADTTIRVESIVSWRTGSLLANQQVELETYLYNVYGR